jgi:hypothetical protein
MFDRFRIREALPPSEAMRISRGRMQPSRIDRQLISTALPLRSHPIFRMLVRVQNPSKLKLYPQVHHGAAIGGTACEIDHDSQVD